MLLCLLLLLGIGNNPMNSHQLMSWPPQSQFPAPNLMIALERIMTDEATSKFVEELTL